MADHSLVTLGIETNWLLLDSLRTELIELVELHLGDGLEIAGPQAISLGGTLHIHHY